MGVCREQCPIVRPLVEQGVALNDISDILTEASNGREARCRTDGPSGQYNRCGLDPTDKTTLQAIALVACRPLLRYGNVLN